jgi:hypothetical protein
MNQSLWMKSRERLAAMSASARSRLKLSDQDAIAIRARRADGESNVAIARDYQVTPAAITAVIKNRSHRLGLNEIRGESNSRKTHCPRGHDLSPVIEVNGRRRRRCLVCRKAQMRAAYERRKMRVRG